MWRVTWNAGPDTASAAPGTAGGGRETLFALLAVALAEVGWVAYRWGAEGFGCLAVPSASGDAERAVSCGRFAEVAATLVIVFLAALVSSIAGFAFSALAGAGLLPLYPDPTLAVEIMVLCSIAIQGYAVIWLRRSIDWARLAPFLAAGLVSLPAGIALLAFAPVGAYALATGSFLIAYGSYSLLRKAPAKPVAGGRLFDVLAGALGGITGGAAGFPGAFVAVWCGMRGWSKDEQRAVLQPYILCMQIATLVGLQALPARSATELATLALYVPAVLLAAHFGLSIFRQLTNRQFSVALHAMLIVSGAALIGRAL